jgi:hypothetical protein
MLASLRPKQECLILGHAIPMPIMLRTRTYDGAALRKEIQSHNGPAVDSDLIANLMNPGEE